jgi:hypothetical protein
VRKESQKVKKKRHNTREIQVNGGKKGIKARQRMFISETNSIYNNISRFETEIHKLFADDIL